MSFEVTGKLHAKYDTHQVNERFRKREFVLELSEEINGNVYTNYAKMQLVQNKCDLLDRYNEGDMLRVNFNIKGNRWERDGKVNFITNLDAWRIEPAPPAGTTSAAQGSPEGYSNSGGGDTGGSGYGTPTDTADDLPF
jgi:hypothetical protein